MCERETERERSVSGESCRGRGEIERESERERERKRESRCVREIEGGSKREWAECVYHEPRPGWQPSIPVRGGVFKNEVTSLRGVSNVRTSCSQRIKFTGREACREFVPFRGIKTER